MKIPILSRLATTLVCLVSQLTADEKPPGGALEKIRAGLPEQPYAKPTKDRKVLVFSRTNGFRHASIATGKLALQELGEKTGAFSVVISDDLENFEVAKLNDYDAVVFLSTTQNAFAPSPAELLLLSDEKKKSAKEREDRIKANLMNFVKSGHGFVGIHAATDSFYEWPEYNKMINGLFDGHPWNADVKVSVKVEPGQEKHPLAEMFGGENVEFPEEIYQFKEPYDSKAVHMLLRLDVTKTDMTRSGIKRTDGDFGISWVRHWEKGRVFYCSLGHNHEIFWNPKVLRHYLAGIQWALGDYQVDVKEGN